MRETSETEETRRQIEALYVEYPDADSESETNHPEDQRALLAPHDIKNSVAWITVGNVRVGSASISLGI
jgi:hypothetical protein